MTLHVHKSYALKCDICGKPKQDGETDIVNLVADPNLEEPTLKSVDVCRDCRDRPIADLLARITELGHVFGPRLSTEPPDA